MLLLSHAYSYFGIKGTPKKIKRGMKHLKKPHVIYIITKLELGGAQKVCLALYEGLKDYDSTTHLITGTDGPLAATINDKKQSTMLPCLIREITFSGLLRDAQCLKELIKHLRIHKKKHPSIIVHTHSTKAGILGRLAAWWTRIPAIHTIHGYGFHEEQSLIIWWVTYLIELCMSMCTTHYICVSRNDAKQGMRLFPNFKHKHTIIRAAVSCEQFVRPVDQAPRFPHAPAPFIFGTISCFKPQKNLTHLIHAFAHIHARMPHAHLEIIGDGIQRKELEKLIIDYKLTSSVTLLGWQYDVGPYIKKWHTFVLSSLWEGLPCAVIEARLLHIPVVAYNTGGIHEIIIHGENGLLAQRGNWHILAEHMLTVLSSEQLYLQMQAYRDDLQDFDTPSMVQDHLALYRTLMYKRRSSP